MPTISFNGLAAKQSKYLNPQSNPHFHCTAPAVQLAILPQKIELPQKNDALDMVTNP